jgi:regulator of protease activity HflC (stomatin/prohibitin superfamily)
MQATAKSVPLQNSAERKGFSINGFVMAVVEVVLLFLALGSLFSAAALRLSSAEQRAGYSAEIAIFSAFIFLVIGLVIVRGFRLVRPDQALVLSAGKNYLGTVRASGLVWTSPFLGRHKISLLAQQSSVVREVPGQPTSTVEVDWSVTDPSKCLVIDDHYDRSVRAAVQSTLAEKPTITDSTQFREALNKRLTQFGVIANDVRFRS